MNESRRTIQMKTGVLRMLMVFCCTLLGFVPATGAAQYPDKPIKMIVAWPAGGATDAIARVIAKFLGERLKQPIIVENRGGASGMVGTDYVAKAAPDGYTLQLTVADSHSLNPHIFPKVIRYDALRDFTPVAMTCWGTPNVLLVGPNIPATTVAQFIQLAKEHPGKLTYASWGIGSAAHIRMEAFKAYAKIDLLHVPFQGGGPAITAILGGQVDAMMAPLSYAESNHRAGKLRVLAVDTAQRVAGLPDVPTFSEQGVSLSFAIWVGIVAPARVPEAIVNLLNRETKTALTDPQARDALSKLCLVPNTLGVDAFGGTPQEVRKFFDSEYVRWGKIIRDANIVME